MSLDSKIWENTLPKSIKENENKVFDVSSEKWAETIPQKKKSNKIKIYSLTTTFFVLGLIIVSVIKNETRSLQKEINELQKSIDLVKQDLHKAEIDYEVLTSPENLSNMAKKYLENDLVFYEKSQIIKSGENNKQLAKLQLKKDNKKISELSKKTKQNIVKKIEIKKAELRKLQEIYSNPSEIPNQARNTFKKKIMTIKEELVSLKESPNEVLEPKKITKWAGIQLVKAFLGIPIVPGK
tara:strand:- start:502 stop:1218 length:717 start_codon:yes stop_codon:yes gene_type:complete